MKELLNTINNIKNNGVSTLVNIFTKKDENKIINKVLNTDKFKKIYKDIDKEKAINIFKSNFILLAAKEDNKNFNRDFIVYDNGGSKEVFLYFEGSRARKWSIEGELIEIKADTEQQQGKEVGKMNNKKELRPIYNEDIKGHKEYIFEQLEKYKSGDLNFTHKRINNKMIEEYTKYFVYKDNTFMAVKPSESGYPSGYYDHVKQYNYRVDHVNKVILFTDSEVGEVQEVEPMGEGQKIDNNINIEEYANNLIESLPIEKNKSAVKYLDYAKENNIKTNDKNSIERKVLQTHLMRYGVSNAWYKAAEKKGVNTKEDLAKVYFNELVKMLKEKGIKEEFYNVDTVTEEQQKENLKLIFDTLESKIDNYIKIVDDIEYFDNFINGIILYFTNGESYQIFIDIDNKINDNNNNFIVLDGNINILYNSNDINYVIDNVIKSAEEKNYYINNSKEYIRL